LHSRISDRNRLWLSPLEYGVIGVGCDALNKHAVEEATEYCKNPRLEADQDDESHCEVIVVYVQFVSFAKDPCRDGVG